jgi:hypothetical protein
MNRSSELHIAVARKGLKIILLSQTFLQATHMCHGQHVASYKLGGHVFEAMEHGQK